MGDLTRARRERRMWGARRYPKNCRQPCEKLDTPRVFEHTHVKGGGVHPKPPPEPQATHTGDSPEAKLNYG